MNRAIWIIMKKELARFFGDKRMVMTTVLLPGLMIFFMYQFMGSAISEQVSHKDEDKMKLEAVYLPKSVADIAEQSGLTIKEIGADEEKKALDLVTEQELDLYLVFPSDFDRQVADYDIRKGGEAPAVKIYYNGASNDSITAYEMVTQLLDGYEGSLCNKFDVNPGDTEYDLATEEDTIGSMFSSMLPMLLMIFLYSGCVAVAPESIAGEKERGTIATLLVTPVRRGNIAMGKIGALSLIALLSGASSTLGTILSLPEMMQAEEDVSANVYRFSDYVLLAVVILSTVLVMVTAISIISAFAKTIKEAQTYVTPLMIIVILVGITAMFGGSAKEELYYYLIPLYNSVQCMIGIFSFEAVSGHIITAVAANLVFTAAGVFVLTRMFHSEKVIFTR